MMRTDAELLLSVSPLFGPKSPPRDRGWSVNSLEMLVGAASSQKNIKLPSRKVEWSTPLVVSETKQQPLQVPTALSVAREQALKGYANLLKPQPRKIGRYSPEQRAIKIRSFLEKRKRRTWSRKVRYSCRMNLAQSRVRVKGRFVKNESASETVDEADDQEPGAVVEMTELPKQSVN